MIMVGFGLWDGEVYDYGPFVRWWGLYWEMDYLHGTLGYNGQRGSKNLEELASGDYQHLVRETHMPYFATHGGHICYTFWNWELGNWNTC